MPLNILQLFLLFLGETMSDNKTDTTEATAEKAGNIPPANLPEELLPVYDWDKGKGKDHLMTAAIALVVAIAVIAIVRYRDSQNAEASYALTGADGVESLEGLSAKYSRTAVAPVISLRLAKAYYDAGQYEQAAETFGAFARKNRRHVLAPQGRLGQATSLEALASATAGGGTDELSQARDIYIELASDRKSPVYAEAVMGQARCLAALGDKAAAGDLLDRLAIDMKDTRWESAAEALRGVIDRFDGFRGESLFDEMSAFGSGAPAAPEAAAKEVVPAAKEAVPAAKETTAPAPAQEAVPAAKETTKEAPVQEAAPAAKETTKEAPAQEAAPAAAPEAEKSAPAPEAEKK